MTPSQIRQHADTSRDEAHYLGQIEDWQEEASQVADAESPAVALRSCPPTNEQASTLYSLYALHIEAIYHIAAKELGRAEDSTLTLDDVLAETYQLFQLVMIRYDAERGCLEYYLANAFRQYVRRYVEHTTRLTQELPEYTPGDNGLEGLDFGVPTLFGELVEEGEIDGTAAEVWKRIETI